MKKEAINKKLNELETKTGIKPEVVIFHHVDVDRDGTYKNHTFSYDENGKKIYYKNGIPLGKNELADIKIIITDSITAPESHKGKSWEITQYPRKLQN